MEKNIKLEQYLGKLDKGLGQIPVSEKAEIITEIKSHILDAKAKDDSKKLEDILAAIGEPELVANRYLIERGLKPMKAPTHPIFKWLIIGFLGTFAIIVIFISILIWRFTPIMKIHDDKVTLLGGTIDVDKESDTSFSRWTTIGKAVQFDEKTFDPSRIKSVNIQNGAGDVTIKLIKKGDAVLRVGRKGHKCDLISELNISGELLVTTSDKHDCSFTSVELSIPSKANVKVKDGSGNINIDSISGNIDAKTGSGDIRIDLDKNTKSKLDLVTGSGDIFVNLPKDSMVDYSFIHGSGTLDTDFVSKKGGSIKISAKTGSGDMHLKAKK
jgi:hypothetical protein